ncbi:MAG: hypothetical protein OEY80_12195, partial [Nitrospirota bacterium]|nr:hypothetical protein [Nitrospirota bacterium]
GHIPLMVYQKLVKSFARFPRRHHKFRNHLLSRFSLLKNPKNFNAILPIPLFTITLDAESSSGHVESSTQKFYTLLPQEPAISKREKTMSDSRKEPFHKY